MSHSHGASSDAEPNLVPLLDLVLQLVMFFMMCAQFAVMEQTDQLIKLPQAAQAKPIPDEGLGPNVVFLGIHNNGEVKVAGRPPMRTEEEIVVFLKRDVYESALRAAKQRGEKDVSTVIVIRADQNADFAQVYRVMRRCQEAGLRKLQLRAIQAGG
jgi:biopolymer transport protein ExbD